jgi:hypothetical protein
LNIKAENTIIEYKNQGNWRAEPGCLHTLTLLPLLLNPLIITTLYDKHIYNRRGIIKLLANIIVLFFVLTTSASAGVGLKCYPNPAVSGQDEVKIAIQPPADGKITIDVFTIDGFSVIRLLTDEPVEAGDSFVVTRWDMKNGSGTSVKPGAYVIKLTGDFGGESVTERFVLIAEI